jgi:hypothetical protein
MVMMACSGYDPSSAVSLWHEFDTIAKRQMLMGAFFAPVYTEIQKRTAEYAAAKCPNPAAKAVATMVRDNKLQFLNKREKRVHMAALPGYVSSFPLEPSIHPYDGVFTGRITVGASAPISLILFTPHRCWVTQSDRAAAHLMTVEGCLSAFFLKRVVLSLLPMYFWNLTLRRSMVVSWQNGVPVGAARVELPDGSAQLCR